MIINQPTNEDINQNVLEDENCGVEVIYVPIEQIIVSQANVRKQEVDYERLMSDIEKNGIRVPLEVWYNKVMDLYEAMDGQNRFLCAKDLVDKYPERFSEIKCLLYRSVTSLSLARTWCRQKVTQQKDITIRDKKRIANELKEKYKSLREGCQKEGLPYTKIYEWSKIPNEILDSPKLEKADSRVLRELSAIPSENILDIFDQVFDLSRDDAIEIIQDIKIELKKTPESDIVEDDQIVENRYSDEEIDSWAKYGNFKERKRQIKWCEENLFGLPGPTYEAYCPQELNTGLLREIYFYLEQVHPETNRNILYYLTSKGLLEKEDDGKISDLTTRGRRAGLIPYDWIIDESRKPIKRPTYDTMEEYLLRLVDGYRSDWWTDQKNYVEVWVEKRTLIQKLSRICDYFNVLLMPCGGWNSETYIEEGVIRFRKRYKEGKEIYIVYLGDFDPSGKKMVDKLTDLFPQRGVPTVISPILLNEYQIEEYDLTWAKKNIVIKYGKDGRISDRNLPWFLDYYRVDYTVEIDALETDVIKDVLTVELCDLIDLKILDKRSANKR